MRLPIVLALLVAGCQAKPPSVDDAWVRLPAVAGRPGAAYFDLDAGQLPQALLAVRTPAAVRTELHESMKMGSGAMTMTPLKQVDVAAGESVAFAPGGRHVMLFDVDPSLKPGETTTLTLEFIDGRTIEAKAKVRGAGDPAP